MKYFIDDTGTFHVRWDDGRGLGLVPGEDDFDLLPPPVQTLKLYMPMTVTYYDEEDDMEVDCILDSRDAAVYAPQIIAALQKERTEMERESDSPEEAERGLMAYYHENDGTSEKVLFYFFTAEVRDGNLWGVAECRVQGVLTPEETQSLRDLICRLAAYWPENPETDDPIKRQTQYGALFDKAVSDVRNGGQASELGEDRKENILIGLENYIIDVASQFPEINQEALDWGLAACETVAANLRQTWEETAQTQKSPQAFGPVLG